MLGPGSFDAPHWDQASQKKVRDALLVLGTTIPDFKKAFGSREEVDPVLHLVGTAVGWGGNPDKDATYERLELHRAPLPAADRNPRWQLGISTAAAQAIDALEPEETARNQAGFKNWSRASECTRCLSTKWYLSQGLLSSKLPSRKRGLAEISSANDLRR